MATAIYEKKNQWERAQIGIYVTRPHNMADLLHHLSHGKMLMLERYIALCA